MHHELNISPEETIYYRYNPEADVLALRLKPAFGPAVEESLPDLPDVTLSRDAATGAPVGLRIAGVQQFILNSLIREVFTRARPYLEPAGDQQARQAGITAPGARQALASPEPSVAPWAGEDAEPAGRRRRGRRRRRKQHDAEALAATAAGAAVHEVREAYPDHTPYEEFPPVPEAVAVDMIIETGEADDASAPEPFAVEAPVTEAVVAEAAVVAALATETPAAEAPIVEAAAASEAPAAIEAIDAVAEDRPRRRRRRKDEQEQGPPEASGIAEVAIAEEISAAPEAGDEGLSREAEDAAGLATPLGFEFAGLDPRLGQAIAAMGFTTPTPIQVEALPVAMAGRDVIGLAQTGTGKTLAFVAAGLHRLLADPDPSHRPRMLILAPTRELTVQVALETERLARFTDLRVATIYGGVGMEPQTRALKQGADLIVATPGRMLDHVRRGNARLGEVGVLVLDEADRMLDMGFLPDVRTVLRFLPQRRQTMLFTATMPPEIESLSMEFQREPVVVEIARRKPPESIEQLLYPVGKHLKAPLLIHLLKHDPAMTSVLVFTERKVDADVLARQLRQSGIKLALMHGDRRQADRERALAALRSGAAHVLVATNVAARGLDIEDISHVVNYDCPQTIDEYVHRIGRTARAEATGKAYTFVTHSDETMITRIETALGRTLPRVQAEGFDYDVPTPNWAKPSARDVMAMLDRQQSVVDRLRGLGRR